MTKHQSVPILVGVSVLLTVPLTVAQQATAGNETLASVNGERIFLEDLRSQIGAVHAGMGHSGTTVRRPEPWGLLERMVNVTLIVQEARTIGLDELPEFTSRLEQLELELLKQQLVEHRVKGTTRGDPEEVERIYRESVGEVKLESVLFRAEDDAKAFKADVDQGADFATLASEMLAQGRASDLVIDVPHLKTSELLPELKQVVANSEVGTVGTPVQVPGGFAVIKLLDVRYPEDPEARAQAEQRALRMLKQQALLDYTDELRDRYVDVKVELADSLDYEGGGPGLEALRNDDRVVAEVRGSQPITVAQLTERIEKKFYHGIDGAIERKRVNSEVRGVLDRMGLERAALLEAERLGIPSSEAYRAAKKRQENNLLFASFMSKVVDPDIAPGEEELKAYHAEHASDYTAPATMRLHGLAFHETKDAQAALEKLREGADLNWVRKNADGQVDPESDSSVLKLYGQPVVASSLGEDLEKALAGAAAGDLLLFDSGGPVYVVSVAEVSAPRPFDFAEIREQVAKRWRGDQRQQAVEHWIEELRAVSEIEYFVDETQLGDLLGLGAVAGT